MSTVGQSAQALAQTLLGLGDRFRNQANTEKSQALAQRYQAMAQEKFKDEQKRFKQQQAHQNFVDLIELKSGGDPTKRGAVAQAAFRDLTPEQQALLPGFQDYGAKPQQYGGPGDPGSVMPQAGEQPQTFGNAMENTDFIKPTDSLLGGMVPGLGLGAAAMRRYFKNKR